MCHMIGAPTGLPAFLVRFVKKFSATCSTVSLIPWSHPRIYGVSNRKFVSLRQRARAQTQVETACCIQHTSSNFALKLCQWFCSHRLPQITMKPDQLRGIPCDDLHPLCPAPNILTPPARWNPSGQSSHTVRHDAPSKQELPKRLGNFVIFGRLHAICMSLWFFVPPPSSKSSSPFCRFIKEATAQYLPREPLAWIIVWWYKFTLGPVTRWYLIK